MPTENGPDMKFRERCMLSENCILPRTKEEYMTEKESTTKREPKSLKELNLVDRFLFDELMDMPGMYEKVLSILLEKKVSLLQRVETEKEFRVSPNLRSVRMDVVGSDAMGKIYHTEMQKNNTGNLIKRSRYYQSQIDVSLLEPGSVDFNQLNDTCMILIAPFDIFGRGLYRYTFRGVCEECPDLWLPDGAVRIFINTQGTNREEFSQEFLDFMEYITNSTDKVAEKSNSPTIMEIHAGVQQIRLSEKMGVKYMQKWEERVYDRMEGREEGREVGRDEINQLNQILVREGRMEDLLRTINDDVFQRELLEEYHISA